MYARISSECNSVDCRVFTIYHTHVCNGNLLFYKMMFNASLKVEC